MTNERKRYNNMENVLQQINKQFVSLSGEEVTKVNPILKGVIDMIITKMKETNVLFENMYESNFYGGSYYDGLKVGKPEEFDIDLRLGLPKLLKAKVAISNEPGFVTLEIPGWSDLEKSNEFAKYKDLLKFKDGNYLEYKRFLAWMESVVTCALNNFEKNGNITQINLNGKVIAVKMRKSGPAFTFNVQYNGTKFDVDLVPVFKMSFEQWPPSPFKQCPPECQKKEYFLVPKPPKTDVGKSERLWRLSFQEQERELINSNQNCKPVLKLLKKLRDTSNHSKISSYYIKTIFLLEVDKQKSDPSFWRSPLSFVFMHMLRTYRDCLTANKIPYYWYQKNNLLKQIDSVTITNFKNYLTGVIESIDKKMDSEPMIVANHLLPAEEREQLNKLEILNQVNKKENKACVDGIKVPKKSIQVVNKSTTDECNSDIGNNVKDIIFSLNNIETNISNIQCDINSLINKTGFLENSIDQLKMYNGSAKSDLKDLNDSIESTDDLQASESKDNNQIIKKTNTHLLAASENTCDMTETVQNQEIVENQAIINKQDQIDFILKKMEQLRKIADDANAEYEMLHSILATISISK